MKALSEIKDEVADVAGYKNWDLLMYTFAGFGSHVQSYNDEVAKRYAEEALREAAEKVEIDYEPHYSGEQEGTYSVDKDSILNLIKELK